MNQQERRRQLEIRKLILQQVLVDLIATYEAYIQDLEKKEGTKNGKRK